MHAVNLQSTPASTIARRRCVRSGVGTEVAQQTINSASRLGPELDLGGAAMEVTITPAARSAAHDAKILSRAGDGGEVLRVKVPRKRLKYFGQRPKYGGSSRPPHRHRVQRAPDEAKVAVGAAPARGAKSGHGRTLLQVVRLAQRLRKKSQTASRAGIVTNLHVGRGRAVTVTHAVQNHATRGTTARTGALIGNTDGLTDRSARRGG